MDHVYVKYGVNAYVNFEVGEVSWREVDSGCIACSRKTNDQFNMEETTLRMEKLTVDTYHSWKFNMRMSLIGKDLWEIVEGSEILQERPTEAQRIQFRKRDNKALSMICLSVATELQIYVRSAKSGKEAWDSLEKHFEEKTLSKKIFHRRKLYHAEMEQGKSMVDHINNVKTIAEHLESLEDAPSEKDLVMILISSLPQEYNNLITTLETLNEDKLTWDYVRDRLISEYERRKESSKQSKEVNNALFAGSNNNDLRSKNKDGPRPNNNHNKKPFKCHYCNEVGHFIRDCPKKMEDTKKKEADKLEKSAGECASFCNSSNSSKMKMKVNENYNNFCPEFALHVNDQTSDERRWLLDSACSKHITGSKNDLVNFRDFQEEDEFEYVTLADKSIVKAVGKGSVNVYLKDENGVKVPVTFENVLYVPKLERLISISQLTERKDVEVSFKNKVAVLQISGRKFIFGNKTEKMYKINYCNFAAFIKSNEEVNK